MGTVQLETIRPYDSHGCTCTLQLYTSDYIAIYSGILSASELKRAKYRVNKQGKPTPYTIIIICYNEIATDK